MNAFEVDQKVVPYWQRSGEIPCEVVAGPDVNGVYVLLDSIGSYQTVHADSMKAYVQPPKRYVVEVRPPREGERFCGVTGRTGIAQRDFEAIAERWVIVGEA